VLQDAHPGGLTAHSSPQTAPPSTGCPGIHVTVAEPERPAARGDEAAGAGRRIDASVMRRILAIMETTPAVPRPRHPSSPFPPAPEPVVERYVLNDRVSHDSYGLGRVVGVDGGGTTVDFCGRSVRIATPFRKMTKL
jgi:hypothetical protein